MQGAIETIREPLLMQYLPTARLGAGSEPPIASYCAVTELMNFDSVYVPVSQRTSSQLLARAGELRGMAATATTEDVVRSLLTLADRYAALAAKRLEAEQSGS
jgi:hypothetical protein